MDGGNWSTRRRSVALVVAGTLAMGAVASGELIEAKEQDAVIGSATSHSRVSLLIPDGNSVVDGQTTESPDASEPLPEDAATAETSDVVSASDDAEDSALWEPIASVDDYDAPVPDMPDPAASDSATSAADAKCQRVAAGSTSQKPQASERKYQVFLGPRPA